MTDIRWLALAAATTQFPAYARWLARRGWHHGDPWTSLPPSLFGDYLPVFGDAPPDGSDPPGAEKLRYGVLAAPPLDHFLAFAQGLVRPGVRRVLLLVSGSVPHWFANWVRVHFAGLGPALGWEITVHAACAGSDVIVARLSGELDPQIEQVVLAARPDGAQEILDLLKHQGVDVPARRLRLLTVNGPWSVDWYRNLRQILDLSTDDLLGVASVHGWSSCGVIGVDLPMVARLRHHLDGRPELAESLFGMPSPAQVFVHEPGQVVLEESIDGLLLTRLNPSPLVRFRTGIRGRLFAASEIRRRLARGGVDLEAELEEMGTSGPWQYQWVVTG